MTERVHLLELRPYAFKERTKEEGRYQILRLKSPDGKLHENFLKRRMDIVVPSKDPGSTSDNPKLLLRSVCDYVHDGRGTRQVLPVLRQLAAPSTEAPSLILRPQIRTYAFGESSRLSRHMDDTVRGLSRDPCISTYLAPVTGTLRATCHSENQSSTVAPGWSRGPEASDERKRLHKEEET